MTMPTRERLNLIGPRISSPEFREQRGIGNEIACYIFDYPPEDELEVRSFLPVLLKHLRTDRPDASILHLDLFDVVLEYLEHRKLLAQALRMQGAKPDADLLKALRGALSVERLRDHIQSVHKLDAHDMVLMSGAGRVWPMIRMHSLLNALHVAMGTTPLLLFYPGCFDGTSLRLFGDVEQESTTPNPKPYYRAFTLVPGGPTA